MLTRLPGGGKRIARAGPRPYMQAAAGEIMLALFKIIELLLDIAWWIIVIQVVLSWLIAFQIINTYNPTVRGFLRALEKVTEPIYRPIRKVLPDFGGLDFSPMIVLLLIYILSAIIVPQIFLSSGAFG
ncbi:MAG: YggT family protein [Allosphingosinicella sp.]